MALMVIRPFKDTILKTNGNSTLMKFDEYHIFEPEYHQERYVNACLNTASIPGAYQLGEPSFLQRPIGRGIQPKYADDEDNPDSLHYEGMLLANGTRMPYQPGENVCVLKSNCIRNGYIDISLARSVERDFYEKNKNRAGIKKNDVLINSTGDGTIGRVAVYNYDFPALVDGHITIIRYLDAVQAWYVAAFLLTKTGQDQLYRYINGSSGQVEIYPLDIERIWIPPASPKHMQDIEEKFKLSCDQLESSYRNLKLALNMI